MLPFVKLQNQSKLLDATYGDNLIFYGEQQSIGFFKIPDIIEQELLQIIPNEYRDCFSATIMRITNSYIRPHTDSDRKVGINFYVKTEQAITTFFNAKSSTVSTEKVLGQTNGDVYYETDLISTGSFIAMPRDVWILDITKVHSVINPTGQDRVAYTLSSNILSYYDTVEILKDFL